MIFSRRAFAVLAFALGLSATVPAMSQETVTASGLRITEVKAGTGETARAGQTAVVHYTGWLYTNGEKGRKFDSSRDRNEPFGFPLGGGRVIKGWDEGVAGM